MSPEGCCEQPTVTIDLGDDSADAGWMCENCGAPVTWVLSVRDEETEEDE
jgi:hypothetical protein